VVLSRAAGDFISAQIEACEIIGNPNAFEQTNTGFVPSPPAEFFTVQR